MDAHTLVKGYILGSLAVNMVLTVLIVGKPRKPITSGLAAFTVAWIAAHMALYAKYL